MDKKLVLSSLFGGILALSLASARSLPWNARANADSNSQEHQPTERVNTLHGVDITRATTENAPRLIPFQAYIADNDGRPLEGAHSLTYRLYDQPTAGAPLWNEPHETVPIDNGVVNVLLGSITPFGPLSLDKILYVGITIDSSADELVPRHQIIPAIFAADADRAEYALEAGHASGADNAARLEGFEARELVPVGTIVAYGGVDAPLGWLLCDGDTHPCADQYAELCDVLQETWGAAPEGEFAVPDLSGRAAVGSGVGGLDQAGLPLSARVVGETGGEETHQLTIAEMPSHAHDGSTTGGWKIPAEPAQDLEYYVNNYGGSLDPWHAYTWQNSPDHRPLNIEGNGGDAKHNNMPPFVVVNYIIKY